MKENTFKARATMQFPSRGVLHPELEVRPSKDDFHEARGSLRLDESVVIVSTSTSSSQGTISAANIWVFPATTILSFSPSGCETIVNWGATPKGLLNHSTLAAEPAKWV